METADDFIKHSDGRELKEILIAFARMHVSLALAKAAEAVPGQEIKDKILESYSPKSII
jgi:ribosomal protein L12E/L44/L45/RPP1/RPP2